MTPRGASTWGRAHRVVDSQSQDRLFGKYNRFKLKQYAIRAWYFGAYLACMKIGLRRWSKSRYCDRTCGFT